MRSAKFVIHKSGPHSFFELLSAEEEIVLHSELHRWRGATEDGVVAVKKNATDDACYQRRKSGKAQHYFVLTSPSGEVLGTSRMYATARALEVGIAGVKRDAFKAEIEK
jgi:uncharacterized protein YegP (UPF0339 family)